MSGFKRFLFKSAFEAAALSRIQRWQRLNAGALGVILTLHHVRAFRPAPFQPNRHLEVTPEFLDAAIRRLDSAGYEFVSLDEAAHRLRAPDPSRRFAAFTLDDGYRNNAEVALPVFRRHGVPFTVFVATGMVERRTGAWWDTLEQVLATCDAVALPACVAALAGGAGMGGSDSAVRAWAEMPIACASPGAKTRAFERIAAILGDLDEDGANALITALAAAAGVDPLGFVEREMMTWGEVARLAAEPLATIGAHTVSHPRLSRLEPARALAEMVDSAAAIGARLGRRPTGFAYPYGFAAACGPREFALARDAGFEIAVTTRPGALYGGHAAHLTALPRVSLNGYFQSPRHVEVMASGLPFLAMNRGRRLNVD